MPTTTDLTKLVINEVDSEATYSAMVSGGLVNPDELYFIPGAVTRTAGILFGAVDGTSTSTVFTATVPGLEGVTQYYDGLTVVLKNGVVTSASGFTLNLNGLGAKPVYSSMSAASQETTIFNVAYTMMFIYDSTRVTGGAWVLYRGYNSNDNTIGYQLRTNSTAMKVSDTARYNKIYFTSADNTQWVPASVNSTNNATAARAVNQRPINPFGRIVYTSASTNYTSGSTLAATTIWSQYNVTLGYSFNRTGAALTLTTATPVYIKCAPQANGSAIIDADTPYVQALPSTEDGKIYIYLGVATSATQVEIYQDHPVYYYKDSAIRLWSNQAAPTVTSTYSSTGTDPINGTAVNAALQTLDSSITATSGQAISAITITDGKISGSTKINVGESNQNAFSNIKVGTTTIAADTKTDTLELVAGTGISLTPDATNDKITITSTVSGDITDVRIDDTSIVDSKVANIATSTSHPYDSTSNPLATIGDIPAAGTTATAVGTTASGGSASTWSKSDHVHSISSSTITGALGYTPYNSTNPNGYTSNVGTITKVEGTDGLTGSATSGTATIKHATYDSHTAAAVKVGNDGTGHVVIGAALTKSDVGLGNVTNDKQLPIAGGTMTGALTLSGAPSNNLHAATKKYVDDSVSSIVNAMLFKGTVGKASGGSGTVNAIPTSGVRIGDTYKIVDENKSIVAANSTTGAAVTAEIGDVIVATATTPKWTVIPSGDEPSGTVTSVATGAGLTGGTITSSGTLKANLRSETKLTNDSAAATETSGRIYPVVLDKSGYLAVNVPWTNVNSNYAASNHTHDITLASDSGTSTVTLTSGGKFKLTAGGKSVIFTMPTSTNTSVKGDAESSYRTGQVNLTPANIGALATTGGTLTGDLTLYVDSGNSPALIFQRGTLTDTYNDWKIYDKGGYLYFAQRGSSSSDFVDMGYIDTNSNLNTFKIPWGNVTGKPTTMDPSSHTHGNITNDGKIGSNANYAVVTTTGGAVTAVDLSVTSPTASSTTTSFIDTVSQSSNGKISATKKTVSSASTSAAGIVQLSSSTSSTSETTAATPKAVKSAYDLAAAAIPKSIGTAAGDIIYWSAANTPVRLAKGTDGQVLKLASGVPTWAADTDTNTHRPIQVNGTEILGNNTTALNLKAGSNVTVTNSSGTVTIASSYTDTKNTAGSTDTSSKIFLVGATSQAANPQTYSDNQVYATNGQLDANKVRVAEAVTLEYNSTTKSLDFIFA